MAMPIHVVMGMTEDNQPSVECWGITAEDEIIRMNLQIVSGEEIDKVQPN
jgi:hypothetical protein